MGLVKENKLNAWDYQFVYYAMKNKKYFISPSFNLVKNIGLKKGSTNHFLQSYNTRVICNDTFKINHPKKLIYFKDLDTKYFNEMYKLPYFRISLTYLFYCLPIGLRYSISKVIKLLT